MAAIAWIAWILAAAGGGLVAWVWTSDFRIVPYLWMDGLLYVAALVWLAVTTTRCVKDRSRSDALSFVVLTALVAVGGAAVVVGRAAPYLE